MSRTFSMISIRRWASRSARCQARGGVEPCRSRSPDPARRRKSPLSASAGCGAASLARSRPPAAHRTRQQHARRGGVLDPAAVHPAAGGGRAAFDVTLGLPALASVERSPEARREMAELYRAPAQFVAAPPDAIIVTGAEPRAAELDAGAVLARADRLVRRARAHDLCDTRLVPGRACARAASRRRAPPPLRA